MKKTVFLIVVIMFFCGLFYGCASDAGAVTVTETVTEPETGIVTVTEIVTVTDPETGALTVTETVTITEPQTGTVTVTITVTSGDDTVVTKSPNMEYLVGSWEARIYRAGLPSELDAVSVIFYNSGQLEEELGGGRRVILGDDLDSDWDMDGPLLKVYGVTESYYYPQIVGPDKFLIASLKNNGILVFDRIVNE